MFSFGFSLPLVSIIFEKIRIFNWHKVNFISFSLQSLKFFFPNSYFCCSTLSPSQTCCHSQLILVFELRCFSVNYADSLTKETETGTAV